MKNNFRTKFGVLVFLVVLLPLEACAPVTYQHYMGTQLPKTKVAVITGDKYVVLNKIDNENVYSKVRAIDGRNNGWSVAVLPGDHELILDYQEWGINFYGNLESREPIKLSRYFEAGNHYQVKYEVLDNDRRKAVRMYIIQSSE